MKQSFTQQGRDEMRQALALIGQKCQALISILDARPYKSRRAREFALQGFGRRLRTLERCIENVHRLIPTESAGLPTEDDRLDATIFLQAFVFNVFGCFDNLAWVWVLEQDVRDPKRGTELQPHQIGLSAKHPCVWNSLPQPFRDYLSSRREWFDRLENYRHSLAHRVPLYIPPYQVLTANLADYERLEREKYAALLAQNFEELERKEAEQESLMSFRPQMKHSFEEHSIPMWFHPQVIADFHTVEEVVYKFLEIIDWQKV